MLKGTKKKIKEVYLANICKNPSNMSHFALSNQSHCSTNLPPPLKSHTLHCLPGTILHLMKWVLF